MRRGKICARQITVGPGSCSYWFDGCPVSVRHCFQRAVRDSVEEFAMSKAEAWAKERDKAVNPEPPLL